MFEPSLSSRSAPIRAFVGALAMTAFVLVSAPSAGAGIHACTQHTWTGLFGDGKWITAANWTPMTVPQSVNDCATIAGFSVDLTVAETIGGLTLGNDSGRGTTIQTGTSAASQLTVDGPTTSSGAETNTLYLPFTNGGSVSVSSGKLWLRLGGIDGVASTGSYGADPGAQLVFGGGEDKVYTLASPARFTGNVSIASIDPDSGKIEGATISVAPGAPVTAAGENTFYGGSFLRGTGTFEVLAGGTLHWTSDPHGATTMTDGGVTRSTATRRCWWMGPPPNVHRTTVVASTCWEAVRSTIAERRN